MNIGPGASISLSLFRSSVTDAHTGGLSVDEKKKTY